MQHDRFYTIFLAIIALNVVDLSSYSVHILPFRVLTFGHLRTDLWTPVIIRLVPMMVLSHLAWIAVCSPNGHSYQRTQHSNAYVDTPV